MDNNNNNNNNNNFESIDLESIFSKFRNSPKNNDSNGFDTDWDSIFSKFKKYGKWILVLIILIFLIGSATKIYYKVTQLNEMGGYEGVFYTNLFYMIASAVACAFLTFITILITNIFAKQGIKKIMKNNSFIDVEGKAVRKLPNFSIALVGAFLTVLVTQTLFYKDIMMYLNATSFGVNTPITNLDVSYYVFQRPLLMDINNYLITFFILIGLYTIGYYLISFLSIFKQDPSKVLVSTPFLRQISIIGALLLLTISVVFKFQFDGLVYGSFVDVTGMGYVQDVLWKPFYMIMPFILVILVVLAIIFVWRHKFKNAVLTVAILPVLFILITIVSSIIQGIIVKPNEPNYENTYLKNNMSMTRNAFEFDKIKTADFSNTKQLSPQIVQRNLNTYNNIRIVDYSSTLKNNIQLESIKNFYTFSNGDIINYNINGKETPIFISAREMNKDNIPGTNPYVSKVFQYTHGYGVVVNPINKITAEGQSVTLLGKLTMDNNGIDSLTVKQPRIYYGEDTIDYSIVNPPDSNKIKEVDYDGSTTTSYVGKGGIKLNLLNKLLFALKYSDFNMLVSSNADSNSTLLLNRDVVRRAQMALPFITVDKDPYIVIDEKGGLKWILDGYTSTDLYPYANSFNGINYIRNSVKIVIDAYDGKVQAYIIDKKDPILQTLVKIYPNVLIDSELPSFVKDHMRFPELLFKLQTEAIKKYHLDPKIDSDINAFYQKQDIWDIAKYSKTKGTDSNDIEPYYNMIQLPAGIGKTEELILMRPFTPSSQGSSRHNMVAWMAARNSVENYGELVLFKFSKSSNVLGPDQVAVNINQINEISKNMTLWNQNGSTSFMGDLLVVPIEDTIMYVQSMYIQSESSSSIPQVRTIIVGYQKGNDFVSGIGNNLDLALKNLFAKTGQIANPGTPTTPTIPNNPNTPGTPSNPVIPTQPTDKQLVDKYKIEIQKHIDEINKLLKKLP